MPRNDRSDSLSVRGEEDPRRVLKGMQQEVERELGKAERAQSGGVEHQSRAEREGTAGGGRPTGMTDDSADRDTGGDDDGQ